MSLKEALTSGRFVRIVDLQPPKGNNLAEVFEQAERLKGRVDGVSVPDLPHAVMRLGSLSLSVLLQEKGIETIFNLSCRDRNRLALQSEILNASALGLKNILLLQGDHPSLGDHPEAKPVFDLDHIGLLGAARRLREGYDLAGNELQGKPDFFVGAEIHGTVKGQALEQELAEMEEKIRLGVDFFVTDSVYNMNLYEAFVKQVAPFKIPILVSITLLKSVGMARYINQHMEGPSIPDSIIDRLMKAPDKREACIGIAADLIKALSPLCQGVRIAPLGWERLVPFLLDRLGE